MPNINQQKRVSICKNSIAPAIELNNEEKFRAKYTNKGRKSSLLHTGRNLKSIQSSNYPKKLIVEE